MNAIWSASHLQIKNEHGGGKMQVSMPVYGTSAFETVSKGSPPMSHHHKNDRVLTSKNTHKHATCCAVHKKDRRVKSSEEINKLKVVTPDKVKQSTSSSHIHSSSHFFTPEITRKSPFNTNQEKKKCTCGMHKDLPQSSSTSHNHKSGKAIKSHHSDERVRKDKLNTSSSLATDKSVTDHSIKPRKHSEPVTSSGASVQTKANTTAHYIFKETSV